MNKLLKNFIRFHKNENIKVNNTYFIKYKSHILLHIFIMNRVGYTPDTGYKSECYPCIFDFYDPDCRTIREYCKSGGHFRSIHSLFEYSYLFYKYGKYM
jgi:hypothetical protein